MRRSSPATRPPPFAVLAAAAAAAAVAPPIARAAGGGVVVQQVEAYTDVADPNNPTRYAPLEFAGATTVTSGSYPGVTFHADADSPLATTTSSHANVVATLAYGPQNSPAARFVSDVYATPADLYIGRDLNVRYDSANQAFLGPGVGDAPLSFAAGAQVVNNSYVGDFQDAGGNLDAVRRVDFMVARSGVVFTAAAVTGASSTNGVPDTDALVWGAYNALAVRGRQSFNPGTSPGKAHADLSVLNADASPTEASFGTAIVGGVAAAVVGQATAAGLPDATRGPVVRGLLMAGAAKTAYNPTTANHLDVYNGAGQPNYDASLGILQGGQRAVSAVTTTGTTGSAAGTPSAAQQGFAAGTVAAAGQSVVLFTAPVAVTGLTASLNWDVTSDQPTATTIDTSDAALDLANLRLDVRPVQLVNGRYVLGNDPTDSSLVSDATKDNVEYLFSSARLAAGTYAIVVGGDTGGKALTTAFGLSYTLRGSFASQYAANTAGSWGAIGNWTAGVPNAAAAVATLPGSTAAATVTLDAHRRVGQLTLAGGNYTITPGIGDLVGTAATLTFDDAGNSSGTAAPKLTVSAGTHAITAPVALANGLTVDVTYAGSGLTLANTVNGTGGLTKTGKGTLTLAAATAYGDTTVTAGTLNVGPAGSLGGNLSVAGGRAAFAAGSALTVRSVPTVSVAAGGTLALDPAATAATRTLLLASTLSLAGRLDLGNGDLLVHNGDLATLNARAATAFAGGNWTGLGLTSTTAAADTSRLTAVGVLLNAAATAGQSIYATFDGQPATATDVLARYTYYGDANLDGKVDAADYTRIDAGFLMHLTGWANGDFNYDGVVNATDYTLIDNAFNHQGAALPAPADPAVAPRAAATTAVPEPSAAWAMAVAAGALMVGRRRASAARVAHTG